MRVFFTQLKNRCTRILAVLFVIAGVVAGPAAIANGPFAHQAIAAPGVEHEVQMGTDRGLLAFEPKAITISPGDTVDWVINKVPPHNVEFDTAKLDDAQKALVKAFPKSKLMIATGETYSVTFPEDAPPGRYPYYCSPHRGAGMVGEVVVQ